MEIVKSITFDENQIFELEMHSFLNVLSVISGIIQIIEDEAGPHNAFRGPLTEIFRQSDAIRSNNRKVFNPDSLNFLKSDVLNSLQVFEAKKPQFCSEDNYKQLRSTLDDIFSLFDVRIAELAARYESPDKWEIFTKEEFDEDFRKFFYAMEKSSNGRYRIIYNIAEQEERDYLVSLSIDSELLGYIAMPFLLKDVVRDIIANARKYTPPGGDITIGIAITNKNLRFVCEDSGYGIPEDEIEQVIDFGFRASNVRNKIRTMGGGFGLTKAYFITKKLDGRFWIESELDKGTRISIEIPLPEAVLNDLKS